MSSRLVVCAWLMAVTAVTACDLVDLHRLEVETDPSSTNAVVARDASVAVTFSRPVSRESAEHAFSLESPRGDVEVDFVWADDGFHATPVERPAPGLRHELRVRGTLIDNRDLSHDVDVYLPFFFGNDSAVPYVLAGSPARGADGGVREALEVVFSTSMDRDRTEDAFSVSPEADVEFSWNGDTTKLTIDPVDQWQPLTYYRWTVSTGALSTGGAPLSSTGRGSFVTQEDAEPPRLIEYRPAVRENGEIVETTDLAPDGTVVLEFSKPVRFSSVREALSTSPAVTGAVEELNATEFLLRFDEPLEVDRTYEVRISEELRDLSGNRPIREERFLIEPTAPRQTIEAVHSVWSDAGGANEAVIGPEQEFGETAIVGVGSPDGTNSVRIDFAHAYESRTTRDSLIEAVEFRALLPERAVNPDIERISWMHDGRRVRISYAGLVHSDSADQPTVYRLRIASGDGSASDYSLGLEEPVELFLETEVGS